MTPQTPAGRAHAQDLALLYLDVPLILAKPEDIVLAIEREAAQQGVAEGAAQERERLRLSTALPEPEGEGWDMEVRMTRRDLHDLLNRHALAILADNSPSASAEPDGEPSE